MNKCVAIVGFNHTKWDGVPWKDATKFEYHPTKRRRGWDIWSCNPPPPALRQAVQDGIVNRWFELHDLRIHELRREEYLGWLAGLTIPVMTLEHERRIPSSAVFPRRQVEGLLPKYGDYHCGSFDWLVAYAIWKGYRRITLHGMNYRDGEPDSSRPCLEFWLGVAAGRGIVIEADDSETLLKNVEQRVQWVTFGQDGRKGAAYGYDISAWPGPYEHGGGYGYRNREMCERPWAYMSDAEKKAHPERDPDQREDGQPSGRVVLR